MAEKKKLPIVKYAIFIAVILAAYFINVEVQTHFGEKALAEIGLQVRSLDEALAVAKQENKQVLADLSAIWCATCRSLDKRLFSDPSVVAAIEAKYVFARIEYESKEGEALMERYKVSGFPNLLVLDGKGDLVGGEGNRLGVKIAAGYNIARRQDERVVRRRI